MKGGRVLAGVAVLAAVVSGCDRAVAGAPAAEATTSVMTSSPTQGADDLAPPVENPKDLRDVDPCALLRPEQLGEWSSGPGKASTSDWGEADCEWVGSVVAIALSPDTTLGDGLDRAYRNKNLFDNFAASEIDGFPAVRVNFATQSCALIVGVSDTQTLSMEFTRVSAQAPGRGDPCGFAESVMADALDNVPDA